MTTMIQTVSYDTASKVIGKDILKRLINQGIVKIVRRSTSGGYIELNSLPQKFRQAFQDIR